MSVPSCSHLRGRLSLAELPCLPSPYRSFLAACLERGLVRREGYLHSLFTLPFLCLFPARGVFLPAASQQCFFTGR